MTPSPFTRYLAIWIALTAASMGALATLNLVVDPFGAYRLVETGASPYRYAATRSAKAEMLRHLPCQDVFVGTSRVEVGIDPRHEIFDGRFACNAALPNTSMVEVAEMVRMALEQPTTERIYLFLDFLMFSGPRGNQNDFARSRLAPDRSALDYHIGNLLSGYATHKSINMLRFAWRGTKPNYDDRGHRVGGPGRTVVLARELFADSLRTYLDLHYAEFVYGPNHVESLRGVIADARARGVELVIAIPPVHALLLEAVDATGLWQVFEDWKRDMANVAVTSSPENPIPAWDFTGYVGHNRVPVPAEGVLASATPWYWETAHFKVDLGDLVLTRTHDGEGEGDGEVAFGDLLAPDTLEAHLGRIREDRERYRATHPEDLEFFGQTRDAGGAS